MKGTWATNKKTARRPILSARRVSTEQTSSNPPSPQCGEAVQKAILPWRQVGHTAFVEVPEYRATVTPQRGAARKQTRHSHHNDARR